MMYLRIYETVVCEIIPEYDPLFPGVPIVDRYAPDFVAQLTPVDEAVKVGLNWVQNEDGTFEPGPNVPPEPDPEYITEAEAIALLFGGSVDA